MQRLGNNLNGYRGETIDIQAVLDEGVAAAVKHGWSVERLPSAPAPDLLAFTRRPLPATRHQSVTPPPSHFSRLYLSTGIHGDEPAGPLAVLELLNENAWPPGLELWLCPCLNPSGFALKQRENAAGADLNRQYLQPTAPETLAHIDWLVRQPDFDLCLCLHEDWEAHGFYLYELNPDQQPSLAETMTGRISAVCPIDPSEVIEGRAARQGIIRPNLDPRSRPQWPESFFLLTYKTRLSYTLEAPSDYPMAVRVAALTAAVHVAAQALAAGAPGA